MTRLCLFYRTAPERDRWLPGDRFVRPYVRRFIRGKPRPGGLDKVFLNLCLGLDKLGVPYRTNMPFEQLRIDDRVGVLGRGRLSLAGYNRSNPIVAGIGLMTHPSEWPTLCDDYPVVRYLQHSEWASSLYKPFFGERCSIWPVGIDTDMWKPLFKNRTADTLKDGAETAQDEKTTDFLIYDKIMWDYQRNHVELKEPILKELQKRGFTFELIRYGNYDSTDFQQALQRCRAMLFLCEHESQGLAYQECLSSGVPILAWDQGWFLDPNRSKWGQSEIPATSVPYFDERCGNTFENAAEFPRRLAEFWSKLQEGLLRPRDYILENLTLAQCAARYLEIVQSVKED